MSRVKVKIHRWGSASGYPWRVFGRTDAHVAGEPWEYIESADSHVVAMRVAWLWLRGEL